MHLESFNGKGKMIMFTISDVLQDISRGCALNNLNENAFSYRIIYYTNEHDVGTKHYANCRYGDLRKTLETIVKNNLSLENTLVFAQTTIWKDRVCVCLQSRSYGFSLDEYFCQIYGKSKKRNTIYNRYARAAYGN